MAHLNSGPPETYTVQRTTPPNRTSAGQTITPRSQRLTGLDLHMFEHGVTHGRSATFTDVQ